MVINTSHMPAELQQFEATVYRGTLILHNGRISSENPKPHNDRNILSHSCSEYSKSNYRRDLAATIVSNQTEA